jgi:hypothetical protein
MRSYHEAPRTVSARDPLCVNQEVASSILDVPQTTTTTTAAAPCSLTLETPCPFRWGEEPQLLLDHRRRPSIAADPALHAHTHASMKWSWRGWRWRAETGACMQMHPYRLRLRYGPPRPTAREILMVDARRSGLYHHYALQYPFCRSCLLFWLPLMAACLWLQNEGRMNEW